MANALVRWFHHLRQRLLGAPKKPAAQRPPDPRVDASPWLAQMLDELGARYRLGEDKPEGSQIIRRTGKERFNPMRVWVRASDSHVAGDYDVRVRGGKPLDLGRELLDRKITGPLGALGLKPSNETVEEWGGHVLTRRYEGACGDAHTAAAAVRFICEQSDQVIDSEAE
jgi:hypothetical protein